MQGLRRRVPGSRIPHCIADLVAACPVHLAILEGIDPMAGRGTAPFETSDNTLRLAEELGVGTRDLRQIEVIGTPIREAFVQVP